MMAINEHTVDVANNGYVEHLTYSGLVSFQQGESIWGVSVGFRAMQAAGLVLSTTCLWDRQFLSVMSAHPGPGVRGAIEYVTHCTSRNRFHLLDPTQPTGCHGNMEFRWWVSDSSHCVEIELCRGFVPSQFFEWLDRVGSPQENADDESHLNKLKRKLTTKILWEPLEELFHVTPVIDPIPREANQCMS